MFGLGVSDEVSRRSAARGDTRPPAHDSSRATPGGAGVRLPSGVCAAKRDNSQRSTFNVQLSTLRGERQSPNTIPLIKDKTLTTTHTQKITVWILHLPVQSSSSSSSSNWFIAVLYRCLLLHCKLPCNIGKSCFWIWSAVTRAALCAGCGGSWGHSPSRSVVWAYEAPRGASVCSPGGVYAACGVGFVLTTNDANAANAEKARHRFSCGLCIPCISWLNKPEHCPSKNLGVLGALAVPKNPSHPPKNPASPRLCVKRSRALYEP